MIKKMFLRRRKGFTLIELLIVVAIIGVLAGIAIPNFLSARTKAKAAKAFADMRIIANGLEMSYLDTDTYPADNTEVVAAISSYVSSVPSDPFNSTGTRSDDTTDLAIAPKSYGYQSGASCWVLLSNGPDNSLDIDTNSGLDFDKRMSGNIGGGNGINTPEQEIAYGLTDGNNGWNDSDHTGDGDYGRGGP